MNTAPVAGQHSGTLPVRIQQYARLLSSDMETPVSLLMGMREAGGPVILLESAAVDGHWGRYSLLACDPMLTVRCRGGKLALEIADERLAALADCDGMPFMEGLRRIMHGVDLIPAPDAELPPITRALCGYFGFGMAGILTPRMARALPPEDAECALVLPRTVLLFDHMFNRLFQVSAGEHRDIRGQHAADAAAPEAGETVCQPGAEGYRNMVRHIRAALGQGEAIQVVPSARFCAPFSGDPLTLYRRMRAINPSPYMFYLQLPEMTLLGASPEVMVRGTDGLLQLSPIAGTRPRGSSPAEDARLAEELAADPKECAEHVMLVDLGRNDLGRVARPGSVRVERLMDIERFSHVMHMTSRITAEAREGVDPLEVLASAFPAGTVSGAPKVRAVELLAEQERLPRGPYAGCVGWLGLDKDAVHMDTGITIRSMWVKDGKAYWQAGSGIVHDSDPDAEWKEVCAKSAIMRLVLDQGRK